jgi:hypothetical protein
LDFEVEDHLSGKWLEAPARGPYHHAASVADDAKLLERTRNARQRGAERSNGAGDVAQPYVVLEKLTGSPQSDEVLEGVRAKPAALP